MFRKTEALIKLKGLRNPLLIHCLFVILGQRTDPLQHWKVEITGFLVSACAACTSKPSISRQTLRKTLFPVWEVESLKVYSSHYLKLQGINEYNLSASIYVALCAWQDSVIEVLLKKPFDLKLCESLVENLQKLSR